MKHVLNSSEHFTISKSGTEIVIDESVPKIDNVENTANLLSDTLTLTLQGLSALEETKWENGQSWGSDSTWK
jgi:hypothetical protein